MDFSHNAGKASALTRKGGITAVPGIPARMEREREPETYEKHPKEWHWLQDFVRGGMGGFHEGLDVFGYWKAWHAMDAETALKVDAVMSSNDPEVISACRESGFYKALCPRDIEMMEDIAAKLPGLGWLERLDDGFSVGLSVISGDGNEFPASRWHGDNAVLVRLRTAYPVETDFLFPVRWRDFTACLPWQTDAGLIGMTPDCLAKENGDRKGWMGARDQAGKDTDGWSNCKAALKTGGGRLPAIAHATGCEIRAGDRTFGGYLPAIAELENLCLYKSLIDRILIICGERKFPDSIEMWSSTEGSAESAWYENLGDGTPNMDGMEKDIELDALPFFAEMSRKTEINENMDMKHANALTRKGRLDFDKERMEGISVPRDSSAYAKHTKLHFRLLDFCNVGYSLTLMNDYRDADIALLEEIRDGWDRLDPEDMGIVRERLAADRDTVAIAVFVAHALEGRDMDEADAGLAKRLQKINGADHPLCGKFAVRKPGELKSIISAMTDKATGKAYLGNGANLNWIDVSLIEDMSYMFAEAGIPGQQFNGDVSWWNVGNVRTMKAMFLKSHYTGRNGRKNEGLAHWQTGRVEDMSGMFWESRYGGEMFGDVSRVRTMENMFRDCKTFGGSLDGWDVRNVRNMNAMFNASNYDLPLPCWADRVGNVRDMSSMFAYSTFSQDISAWKLRDDCKTEGMFIRNRWDTPFPEGHRPEKARKK